MRGRGEGGDGEASTERVPLAALRERNFRLLLFGNGLSHTGDQMEWVARGWLVLELTDSPLALGLVLFFQGVPRLFLALLAGALADRFDRRSVLLLSTLVSLGSTAAFTALTASGLIQLWHIYAIVVVGAASHTLNIVTRQALIPDIVPREHLGSALALHSSVRGTTQIVAQSVAGVLVAIIGVPGVLLINCVSFLAMLWALLAMRIPPAPAVAPGLGMRKGMLEALAFVWRDRDLRALMALGLLPFMLVMPYRSLLPVFARDVWDVGAAGYGVLMAAPGIGALLASGALAAREPRRRGLLMLGSLAGVGMSLIGFALSPTFLPAVVCTALVGLTFNIYRVTSNTALQLHTPRAMMGRVMGVYHMDRGLMPVGGLLLGALASIAGAPLAVAAAGAACVALTVGVGVARPSLRRL